MQEEVIKLIEEFEERLEKLKEKYKECEFEKGDFCWSISESGSHIGSAWRGDEYNESCYRIGNAFKTQEEAIFMVNKLEVIHELKQLARPFSSEVSNWLIQYSNELDMFIISPYEGNVVAYGDFYFDDQEEAKKAINKIGEGRIKKYLFGVVTE